MTLAGKKVVVVGGSSGIGLATAELAKNQGADVVIASRSAAKLDPVAERLKVTAIAVDVTSDQSVADLFRRTGPVDHVVLTAAQLRTGPFKTVAMEDVRATMEGKFWGAWRVAREAVIRPGGSLTLVTGFLSVRPRPNSAIIGAANGALESLARALALELAPARVNAVSPGVIDTPIRAGDAGGGEAGDAGQDGGIAAGRPRRRGRRHRPTNRGVHDQRLCHRIDRLHRRRRIGRLRAQRACQEAAPNSRVQT
jgi:NAD(P)-dependent dehydrogenase (short-subunit alcohol dehydrogenase family)